MKCYNDTSLSCIKVRAGLTSIEPSLHLLVGWQWLSLKHKHRGFNGIAEIICELWGSQNTKQSTIP